MAMTLREYFDNYYSVISRGDLADLDAFYFPNSPLGETNKQQFEAMRKQFSFELKLMDVSLLAKQDELLIVRDQLVFEATIEGEARTKRSSNIHTLVKSDENWCVYSSNPLPESMVL
ncbi:hypothetical protein [Pseudoalteromonas xiamenensis]